MYPGGKSPRVNVDALQLLFTVTFPLWKDGIHWQLKMVFRPSSQSRASTVPFQNCSLVFLKLQYWEASSFSMEKTVCSNPCHQKLSYGSCSPENWNSKGDFYFKAVASWQLWNTWITLCSTIEGVVKWIQREGGETGIRNHAFWKFIIEYE